MTCKDIRTYCANQIFKKEYSRLLKSGISEKKSRIEATKLTALELGNTPKVCRDSYIDPSNY
jgi:DNA topoisomerase IB